MTAEDCEKRTRGKIVDVEDGERQRGDAMSQREHPRHHRDTPLCHLQLRGLGANDTTFKFKAEGPVVIGRTGYLDSNSENAH